MAQNFQKNRQKQQGNVSGGKPEAYHTGYFVLRRIYCCSHNAWGRIQHRRNPVLI